MKKYILGIIVIIAVIFVSGCITDSNNSSSASNETQTLSQNGISIQYPGNWVVADSDSNTSIAAVADPSSKDSSNNMGNINVNIEKTDLPMALNSYFNQTYSKLKSNSNYQITTQGNATVGSYDALECVYLSNEDGIVKQHEAYWVENNNELYVILCTAPQKDFQNQKKNFDFILDSFQITG